MNVGALKYMQNIGGQLSPHEAFTLREYAKCFLNKIFVSGGFTIVLSKKIKKNYVKVQKFSLFQPGWLVAY